jgi:aspartate kinase
MRIYKFGGASLKNAQGIKNVGRIIQEDKQVKKGVIVSAIGNTTNQLEEIVEALKTNNQVTFRYLVDLLYRSHIQIASDLLTIRLNTTLDFLEQQFVYLNEKIHKLFSENEEYEYDQIVSLGEVISSKIVEAYLAENVSYVSWINAKELIRTNANYKQAEVDWSKTNELILNKYAEIEKNTNIFITQGFIGSTREGITTTLGREGSDYTAAIFAYTLNAESLTIWKDVPGMLNADPKWFDETIQLPHISFQEAIELAYYGANVIHPKTIKPLQNKNIPLYVKSFIDTTLPGTIIDSNMEDDTLIPSFIFKMNQLKISITPKDFSFIAEEKLSQIFNTISSVNAHINLMQNSAISFDFVIDNKRGVRELLTKEFENEYTVSFKEELELVTIRHYDQETIERVTVDKEIIITQQTKHTTRMLMRDLL